MTEPSEALVGVGAEGRAGRGELVAEVTLGPEGGATRARVGEVRGGVCELGRARAMSECFAMVTLVLRR